MIWLQSNFGIIKDPNLKLQKTVDLKKVIPAQLGFSGVTYSAQANLVGVR
jgi:hypothetical protein